MRSDRLPVGPAQGLAAVKVAAFAFFGVWAGVPQVRELRGAAGPKRRRVAQQPRRHERFDVLGQPGREDFGLAGRAGFFHFLIEDEGAAHLEGVRAGLGGERTAFFFCSQLEVLNAEGGGFFRDRDRARGARRRSTAACDRDAVLFSCARAFLHFDLDAHFHQLVGGK